MDSFGLSRGSSEKMSTDIVKTEQGYQLTMDLPGYDKKDIAIDVKDGYLTITGTKKAESQKNEKDFVYKERFYGKCQRKFYIGSGINEEEIKAKYDNGVLTLDIPGYQEPQKKLISVE